MTGSGLSARVAVASHRDTATGIRMALPPFSMTRVIIVGIRMTWLPFSSSSSSPPLSSTREALLTDGWSEQVDAHAERGQPGVNQPIAVCDLNIVQRGHPMAEHVVARGQPATVSHAPVRTCHMMSLMFLQG